MSCRKNQRNLSSTERTAFVNAMVALKTTVPSQLGLGNRYDDYVHWHMMAMDDGSAHRGPAFLPWHREFLRRLELDLRAVDPEISIPYWDWTVDNSPNPATPGSPWTDDFMGGNGDPDDDDRVTTGQFAFATGNWPLAMDEDGFGFLRRNFGAEAATLPTANNVSTCLTETPYDESPWNDSGSLASFRNRLEGWFGPGSIHNRVHLWVGGSMLPGTSPNDPVFFLHHCNIDRLWTLWNRALPGEQYHPQGTPGDTGPAGHNVTQSMNPWGGATTVASVLDSHAIGVWYDTDPPEIDERTMSLAFVDVQEGVGGTGVTTYRAILLRVIGCSPVEFEFVGNPTGGFTKVGDDMITFEAHDAPGPTTGRLWIAYNTNSGTINGQVTVRARARDSGGNVIWEETWDVALSANSVPRQRSAIAVVLDRSGSMGWDAGDGTTRISKLRSAMHSFIDLMQPGDGLGIVRFDDEVNRLMDVGDVGTPGPARTDALDIIDTHDAARTLDPRGNTAIGLGLIEGQAVLTDAAGAMPPYENRAILVMTDGNENVPPMVHDVGASGFDTRTFAIGFGPAHDVSAPTLTELTDNHQGYMVVTGAITPSDQFRLTKYFLQVQTGITNQQIVVDPTSSLVLGAEHRIPFWITEAEMGMDVIVLCPAPYYLDFTIETPAGVRIDPPRAAAEPAIDFALRQETSFYRVTLPALPGTGSHAGRWHAVLRLGDRAGSARLSAGRLKGQSLPYSVVVRSHSNLRFAASLHQKSYEPGAAVTLFANLSEYDVPVERRAQVWADVTLPGGSERKVTMGETDPGQFTGGFTADYAGVYQVRVYARGNTFYGTRFTREQVLSAVAFKGGDAPPSRGDGGIGGILDWLDERDKRLCKLLECLTSEHVLGKEFERHLRELGVDLEALRKCLARWCQSRPAVSRGTRALTATPAAAPQPAAAVSGSAGLAALLASPELREALEAIRMESLTQKGAGFATLGPRPPLPPTPPPPAMSGGHHGGPVRPSGPGHQHGDPHERRPMFDLSPQDKAAPGRHDRQEGLKPTAGHPGHEHGPQAPAGHREPHSHGSRAMFDLSPQDKAAPGEHDRQEDGEDWKKGPRGPLAE